MARYRTPGAKEVRDWQTWVASHPPSIREVAEKVLPWELYRVRSYKRLLRGVLQGLTTSEEPCQVALLLLPRFNPMLAWTEFRVIVPVEQLEPCDLPGPADRVGAYDIAMRADGWFYEH